MLWWAAALERCCDDHADDLQNLAAWSAVGAAPIDLWQSENVESRAHRDALRDAFRRFDSPTLREVAAAPESIVVLIESVLTDLASIDTGEPRVIWLRTFARRCSLRLVSRRIE